jgi:hypothetical protein
MLDEWVNRARRKRARIELAVPNVTWGCFVKPSYKGRRKSRTRHKLIDLVMHQCTARLRLRGDQAPTGKPRLDGEWMGGARRVGRGRVLGMYALVYARNGDSEMEDERSSLDGYHPWRR